MSEQSVNILLSKHFRRALSTSRTISIFVHHTQLRAGGCGNALQELLLKILDNPERFLSEDEMRSQHRNQRSRKPAPYFWTSEEFHARCKRFIKRMRHRGTFGKESEQLDLGAGHQPLERHLTWLEVKGDGMAPRFFDGEAILANLDATAAIGYGTFGIVAWKRHPEPVLRRTFLDHGKVVFTALSGEAPIIVDEKDVLFFCPIRSSELGTCGTAISIHLDRKEAPKRYRKFYRVVDSTVLA